MIIQCEKCQTRFRLDDSRVTAKGVKVRCTKCKHVFTVRNEDAGAELFEPEGGMFGFSIPVAQGKTPAADSEEQRFAEESVPDAPAAAGPFG
ncbi:MAG: zinc-ribbon domain-containing protein, partial [Desulfuromonadaceae bacterium]